MVLARHFTVFCDGCGFWTDLGGVGRTAREARAIAKRAGMVRRDSRDLCSVCDGATPPTTQEPTPKGGTP